MTLMENAIRKGAEYADLRHDVKTIYSLLRENRATLTQMVQVNAGYCLRVIVDGAWGTGITTDERDLPRLLTSVLKAARSQHRGTRIQMGEAPPGKETYEKKAKNSFKDDNQVDFMVSLEDCAHEQSPRISSLTLFSQAIERQVHIETSEERTVDSWIDTISLRMNISCKEGNSIESRTRTWGGIGGTEYIRGQEDLIMQEVTGLAREADILVDADHSPSSTIDCVLSHSLTGTLLHEAFGHAVEADSVISNESILAGRIGEKVAVSSITMVDDPSALLFGHYAFDHEGTRGERTTVVDRGILCSYLHSRETAAFLHSRPTGHCKAEFYSNTPIVRQGNTILIPRDHTVEELLELGDGLYLGDSAGGQVNVGEGTFTFGTQFTRKIHDGELGEYMKGCSLSGNILESMKNVDAVGKDTITIAAGCGKGQMDLQGRSMPQIRLREVMIGGRGS
ncbi:MAG: TldD/PmbA family protein [Theionarchaea archaeon]|nr:TldD/PmbA family protein [Theionarchaea archaeon]